MENAGPSTILECKCGFRGYKESFEQQHDRMTSPVPVLKPVVQYENNLKCPECGASYYCNS